MCFGNSYEQRTKVSSRRTVRDDRDSRPTGPCGGCSDDGEAIVVSHPRIYRRNGAGQPYYPIRHHAGMPRGGPLVLGPPHLAHPVPVRVHRGGVGVAYGGRRYVPGGRVALPSSGAMVSCSLYYCPCTHAPSLCTHTRTHTACLYSLARYRKPYFSHGRLLSSQE